MGNPYLRAPHADPLRPGVTEAPNAALLIDFDNVTMGMRSDLAKELKHLLNSDVIKGKVTVQRAYADWRRYPQYIVPLSEASIDLIFAPAYGSSKKNATDIRMAIDGMELVFIRPEIGTFILLTGDSDFSSLVLKLKEYGKYVVGIGIQESSSDILVQNCDEYYSYTSITGLSKTSDGDSATLDPWQCVEEAVGRMASRGDVMRSDRLKQVMIELSPNFDERNLGFKKFSKFLIEAANKGLLHLKRGENGQYEVGPASGGRAGGTGKRSRGRDATPTGRNGDESRRKGRSGRRGAPRTEAPKADDAGAVESGAGEDRAAAMDLLKDAMAQLGKRGRTDVRDSDVKRKMLSIDRSFDEGTLGFAKFSKFLQFARDREVVALERLETGNYKVRLPTDGAEAPVGPPAEAGVEADTRTVDDREEAGHPSSSPALEQASPVAEPSEAGRAESLPADDSGRARDDQGAAHVRDDSSSPREAPSPWTRPSDRARLALELPDAEVTPGRLGPRRSDRGKRGPQQGSVVLHKGQIATVGSPSPGTGAARSGGSAVDVRALGLPSTPESMVSYLAHRYRGVGLKTAEVLVDAFGSDLFSVLQSEPERVKAVVPEGRADQVLAGWTEDYARRSESRARQSAPVEEAEPQAPGHYPGGTRRSRDGANGG